MSINQLINELKENEQDFEFYPTTKEMIKTIYEAAPSWGEWLDIGAGTCNFRKYFLEFAKEQQDRYNAKETAFRNSYKSGQGYNYDLQPNESDKAKGISNYYVIEKSKILLEKMEKDVICLGTDFNATMLLDKPVDNIFCNPPYSEFEQWTERLIYEANTKRIFLVIPERWKNSEAIQNALKKTGSIALTLGSADFLHAERQARAKVEIIRITRKDIDRYRDLDEYNKTAFDQWFDDTFKMRDKKDVNEWEQAREQEQIIKNKLVNAEQSKAKTLVDLYNDEIATLFNHFKAIAGLDVDILETIGISKKAVKEALKKKASGAKAKYWKLALDELEEITDRLTSKTRQNLFNKFTTMHTIDFTLENLYPVILWVLKNANEYYNDQLIDFYKELSSPDNVRPYKSNQKVFERCEWRHNKFKNPEQVSHYTLDYRIIMSSPFRAHWFSGKLDDSYNNGAKQTLQDIFTIANNLGFKIGLCDIPKNFGEKCTVLYDKSDKVFMEYRAYKNGNMHVKFDIEFMKALNVEVSRLLGWIKSAEDIKKEFPAEMAKGAEKYFKSNYTCLNVNSMALLTTAKKPAIDHISNEAEQVILINDNYLNCLDIIINHIAKFNDIIESTETIEKCKNILTTEKGFIYRNCLITKHDNKTKIEFRESKDFTAFENLLKEVA